MYAEPAHRRFVNDLRDPRCIPAVDAPEIVALEGERARLVAALDQANRGGGRVDVAHYIAQRAKAIRAGTELPPEPPTAAELQAGNEKRSRNVAAAENALLALADTICETVRNHKEWEDEARERVAAAQAEAEAAMAQAKAAARRAEDAHSLVIHLERVAADELYPNTASAVPQDEPGLVWDITDPHVRDLMALSRTGSPL
jgi:hypothetical protein